MTHDQIMAIRSRTKSARTLMRIKIRDMATIYLVNEVVYHSGWAWVVFKNNLCSRYSPCEIKIL